MAGQAAASRLVALLEQRQQLTDALQKQPYDIILYLRRAVVYSDMGYPDLAAGDASRAIQLNDEMRAYCYAYSKQTYETFRGYAKIYEANGQPKSVLKILRGVTREQALAESNDEFNLDNNLQSDGNFELGNRQFSLDSEIVDDPLLPICGKLAFISYIRGFQIMAFNLFLCGCLRSAYFYYDQGLVDDPGNRELLQIKALVETAGRQRLRQSGGLDSDFSPDNLPDRGFARREVYPWNIHEPHRCSDASLACLNERLAKIAPKCEVRAVELPVLSAQGLSGSAAAPKKCWQLGIFAKEPIAAGEVVLREHSVLTANNRHKAEACDACGSNISGTNVATDIRNSSVDSIASCNQCHTMYCGEECYNRARVAYHSPVCDQIDVASFLAKDWGPRDDSNELYLLLVSRVLVMAALQKKHPLEVKEVKYLWGDFVPAATNTQNAISSQRLSPGSPEVFAMAAAGGYPPATWSLPFDFRDQVTKPILILDEMGVDVSRNLANLDVWVLNTLFAKLRGTASARKSRQDGPLDMAAVHPLWSLTNHDCDPNVTWEWGRCMVLRAKEERVQLAEDKAAGKTRPGGIAAGEEILNHYCDVDLPVQQRREWASGSLGGICMCLRCQNEAAAERGESLTTSSTIPACTFSCHE
ncbi:hypothetical protein SEPCBS119000_000705 [Sporothrix epigloea]|uniref:SET domain-containing protein n=1 Tax=Sporothrix epigloea TaxID=1892477 RepID=A0ABP0D6V6_9PEZI